MARSGFHIPVFDSLIGNKKEIAIREAMGWNGFESVGFLVCFWIRAAADFPNGELSGLDDLKALLRRVWKASDIKPRSHIIQLMADTLLGNALIDEVEVEAVEVEDVSCVFVIHDWEDGGGKFEMERQYEKEKKRKQRAAARGRALEDVPGTPESCPPNVPPYKETKRKETITPPNPPQAGGDCGDFSGFQKSVKDAWREACARVPVDVIDDNKTTQGVASLAKQLMAGKITMDQVRNGMAEFLRRKYRGAEDVTSRMASWGLNTVANNPSAYQPIGGVASTDKPATVLVEYRCDQCGETTTARVPAGDARPFKCTNQPRRGETCSGMFHPLGEVVRS